MNIAVGSNQGITSGYNEISTPELNGSINAIYGELFSCGIKKLVNIESFYLENDDSIEKLKDFFIQIFNGKIEGSLKCAMWELSITDSNPELTEMMDELCDYKTDWHINPNSGNNIRIYTFVVNK